VERGKCEMGMLDKSGGKGVAEKRRRDGKDKIREHPA
jgi:hypothetical protein